MLFHLLLKSLLVPQVAIAVGWVVTQRWMPVWSQRLAVLLLYVSSLPLTAVLVSHTLQVAEPAVYAKVPVVVLGGGRMPALKEYGKKDGPSLDTLQRLRYAAYLSRSLKVPVIVSGGTVLGETESEAQLMRRSLVDDFQIPSNRIMIERASRNTQENAQDVAHLLPPHSTVILVTSALHMRRALKDFKAAGLSPVPATVGAYHGPNWKLLWLFPSIRATTIVSSGWMEWVGLMVQGH